MKATLKVQKIAKIWNYMKVGSVFLRTMAFWGQNNENLVEYGYKHGFKAAKSAIKAYFSRDTQW